LNTIFVQKQKLYVKDEQLKQLEVPKEEIYIPLRNDINIGL